MLGSTAFSCPFQAPEFKSEKKHPAGSPRAVFFARGSGDSGLPSPFIPPKGRAQPEHRAGIQ
jgi:hypothetical protein